MTINDRLHSDGHPIVTVTVTEETAWVSGLLVGVTVMTIMTVVCGCFLIGTGRQGHKYSATQTWSRDWQGRAATALIALALDHARSFGGMCALL